jgi:hypothetical protein
MSFTIASEKLIKNFIDEFENHCGKKSKRTQQRTDSILKMIYQDILISQSFISILDSRKLINTEVKEIKTLKELPKSNLMDSSFMPNNIKDKILYSILGYVKTTIKIGKITVNVYYGLFKKSDFNKLSIIKKEIMSALRIIKFCTLYKNLKTMEKLDIYLYLTDFQKNIPKNPVLVLNENNCNSAVTFACASNGKVLIYRKEEWKKVLIHELFHSLCLDFAGSNYDTLRDNIKNIFNVNSDFEISESYTEFWATIVNSCFISYSLLDNYDDIDNFLLFTDFCIQLERMFSLYQMIKILNYMGLRYDYLYKNDDMSKGLRKILYKEDTNVLCYYIIKTILLYFNDEFLEWCMLYNNNILKFNKTEHTFKKFYEFIKQRYDNKFLLKSINKMELFYKKSIGPVLKGNKILTTTSRMTICEN